MKRLKKAGLAVCLVTAAVTALSACSSSGGSGNSATPTGSATGSSSSSSSSSSSTSTPPVSSAPGFNAANDGIVNASTKTGGTLKLLSTSDCDSWDPQRTYYGWCFNMQRLFTRTLVGYSKVNGDKFTLTGDLATGLGQHNADYTQWTYTLKPGLKFSTGKAITPLDIKYGIERLFAGDVINGGPSFYYTGSIAHPANYQGPYKSGDLSTIKTTSNTITFNLSTPYADFDYLMALPTAAPVPYKVEGGKGFVGATYTKHPVSSGPFQVQSYQPNKSIVFTRNQYWQQSTDTIRHPLVDSVDLEIDTNPTDLDAKLQAGSADANASNTVTTQFQSKILSDSTLGSNADDPVSTLTRYMSIAPSVIPNVHCRRAIFYAFDKEAALRVYGGAAAGQIATSMTPPGIDGYDPTYNPYPSGDTQQGDVAKAKQELQLCGQPNGFSTKFAYSTPSETGPKLFTLEQQALARVGIKITAATQDSSTYYSTFIGSPANIKNQGLGIAVAGWGADFPTGVGFYESIADGKAIHPTGNSNYPSLNDPTVNKVLANAPKGQATQADWQSLNHAVMNAAVYLPFIWGKDLYYRNPRMTNVTCNNALAFGIYDFVNVGVS